MVELLTNTPIAVRQLPACTAIFTIWRIWSITHQLAWHVAFCIQTTSLDKHPMGCEAQLAWKCLFTPAIFRWVIFTCNVGQTDPVFAVCSLVDLCTQDYKSLCAAVTSATLVNMLTHRHTDRQTAFWPAYMNSSAGWAKNAYMTANSSTPHLPAHVHILCQQFDTSSWKPWSTADLYKNNSASVISFLGGL